MLQRIVNATAVDDHQCRIPFHVYADASDNIVTAAAAQAAFPGASTIAGNHFTILGPSSPGNRTADVVKHHMIKATLKDYAGAVALGETVVADRTRVPGERDPATMTARAHLACWRALLRRSYDHADMETVVSDHVRVLGERHASTLRAQGLQIEARTANGDYADAIARMTEHIGPASGYGIYRRDSDFACRRPSGLRDLCVHRTLPYRRTDER